MGVWAYGRMGVWACAGLDDGPLRRWDLSLIILVPSCPIHSQRYTPHLTLPRGYTNTYSRRYAHTPTRPVRFLAGQPAREGEELSVSAGGA